jgi:hypothetical protein
MQPELPVASSNGRRSECILAEDSMVEENRESFNMRTIVSKENEHCEADVCVDERETMEKVI